MTTMGRWLHLLLVLCFEICQCFAADIPGYLHCSFDMYFCKSKACEGVFYKAFRDDPSSDCSEKFQELLRCNKRFLQEDCYRDYSSRVSRELDLTLHALLKEDVLCNASSLAASNEIHVPRGNKPCSDAYYYAIPDCHRRFRVKFLASKADPALCREYASVKKCVKRLVESECKYSEVDMQMRNYQTSDINPFCDNMRDPGSKNHTVCVGYFDTGTSSLIPSCASLLWLLALSIHSVLWFAN